MFVNNYKNKNKGDSNNNSSIFEKKSIQSVKTDDTLIFNKNEIMSSIPEDAFTEPNQELLKTKTEWRWRIYSIPNKKNEIIEISYKEPNSDRMFMSNKGDWILINETQYHQYNYFEQFIVNEYYIYNDLES
jgi:hypothetical protein